MSSRNRLPRIDGSRRKRRSTPPLLENLENRLVLSAILANAPKPTTGPLVVGNPSTTPFGHINSDGSSTSVGLSPNQIRAAYGMNQVTFGPTNIVGNGTGQTIAIVIWGDNTSLQPTSGNFAGRRPDVFDKAFNLPAPPSFTIYTQNGQVGRTNTNLGTGDEIALDVEYSHSMAPDAKIDLVEASTGSFGALGQAIYSAAVTLDASVVSMSWGASLEGAGYGYYEPYLDSYSFIPALEVNPNVTFLASTGDSGAAPGASYPAVSPYVVGVGGTVLSVGGTSPNYTYVNETGWTDGGGGISDEYAPPAFQGTDGFLVGGKPPTNRTIPDVSSNAGTPVAIYDPQDFSPGWVGVEGTSISAPCWAGFIAVADQGRAEVYGEPPLGGPSQTLPALYELQATANAYTTYFHDITKGNNGYAAGTGYDLVTGIGSPRLQNLLPVLAGYGAASQAVILIQPPTDVIQGGYFGTAIEAETSSGALAIGFNGTATISLLSGPGALGGTLTVNFSEGIAVFDTLTLSTVSGTPNDLKVVVNNGNTTLSTLDTDSVTVNKASTANIGVYYPLPLDTALRADLTAADADNTNATDDLYLVYSQAYVLSAGQLVVENTSTLSSKTIKWIGSDEFAPTTPVINAQQTSRVFDIIGMKHGVTNLSVLFQGLAIEGGLATDDGGLTITSASAVGGGLLIDGGVVALSNVTVKDNEAMGATGAQGSTGASRSAGPGGEGYIGGNSHGGAIYLAAGTLTLDGDQITGNVAQGGTGGEGGTGGLGGSLFTFFGSEFFFPGFINGGLGGTGGQGGIGAGGALYIAGGNVSITGGNVGSNSAVGGVGGQGGQGGHAGTIPFAGGTGGIGGSGGIGQGGGIYLGGGSLVLKGSAQVDHNKGVGGAGGKGGEGGSAFESSSDTSNFGPGGNGGAGGAGNDGYGGGMYVSSGTITWTSGNVNDNSAAGGISGLGGAVGFPFKGGSPGTSPSGSAGGFGGGIYGLASFTLSGADIESNSATLGGGIDIHGSLTLSNDTLSGNFAATDGGAVYSSAGTLTVTNGTISGNTASATGDPGGLGAGIYASGTVNVTGATLSGNVANGTGALGGAIFTPTKTTLTVKNATIENNTAVAGGGGIAGEGTLVITSDTFQSNKTTATAGDGGAIDSAGGSLTISGTTVFTLNSVKSDGGAIYSDPGNLTISGGTTTFQQNSAKNGGAIYAIDGAKNSMSITGGSFTNNTATASGGAIDIDGTLTLSGVTLSSNTAGTSGGALFGEGTLTAKNGTVFSKNKAEDGGGIYNEGKLVVDGGDITANSAGSMGAGVYNSGGSLSVTGATISANAAGYEGGGLYVKSGAVTLSAFTTIESDSAGYGGGGIYNAGTKLSLANDFAYSNTAAYGGGILNAGTMTISIVTFAGNSASIDGGGIYNQGTGTVTDVTLGSDSLLSLSGNSAQEGGGIWNDGTLTGTNSTIADNSASGSGGGVYNMTGQGGVLTTINVTIADNETGGGLFVESGTVTLYNTIVAGNTADDAGAADDIATATGIMVAGASSNNLIGTGGSGGLTNGTNGNQVGIADPGLDPNGLQDNGGPTQTVALVTGSTAIDGGSNSIAGQTVPTTDQRGAQRGPTGLNAGLTVDIGAYEASSSYLVTTAGDSLAYGTLRSAVNWANFSFNDNQENITNPAPNTIRFDTANVFSAAQTITLTLGTLDFTNTGTAEAIDGDGSAQLTISGNSAFEVLSVANGVTAYVSELTIANGSAAVGGGILNAGSLTVESGTVIEDNTAGVGAGIYNFGGSLEINNAAISGNAATGSAGGGIFNTNGGSVTITGTTISGNKAANGGGIYLGGGSLSLIDSSIANNTATIDGGGIMNVGGSVKIAGGSLTGNLAEGAGSTSGGGAIYNAVNYSSSSAGGTLTITGTTISANKAVNGGGGIYVYSGALTLNYGTLAGNSAGGDGGGIYNYNPADQAYSANSTATATVVGTTLSGNTAAVGGAIENDDTLSFTNTTIANNSATDGAGVDDAGTLTAVNATIADNTLSTGGFGGGLNVEGGGDAILYNSIIALNTINGGTADDIAGTADSASSYNLIGQGGAGGLVDSQGNQVGVDSAQLALSLLGNNGGPTETISLQAGSIAIDAGSNSLSGVSVPTIDQRGALRGPAGLNAGPTVDIGAYEASSSYLVSTFVDTNAVGTLRTSVGWANISTNANPEQTTNPEPNTVVFDVTGTFTLSQGPIALSNQTTATKLQQVIDAPGETISGGGVSGVFTVASGVSTTLEGTSTAPLTIMGGKAANDGGGIDNSGILTLSNVDLTGNTAIFGGGLANEAGATLSATDTNVTDNTGTGSGGGIANMGTATLLHDYLTSNVAPSGGGIWNSITGTLSILGPNGTLGGDTTIAANSATVGGGGGIDNSGSVTIGDSTLFGNSAALTGGGIYDESGGSFTATNITLANNAATNGGGIATAGTLVLINGTIAYNTVHGVGSGGGLSISTGGIDILYNTIIAKNTNLTTSKASDIALSGTGNISPVSANNLVGTGGAGSLVNHNNGNLTGVSSPGLASGLANNGGPTETIALVAGSPAIDAGIASIAGQTIPTTDQRGAVRGPAGLDAGALPDIGAFEESSSYLVTTTAGGLDVGTIKTAVSWADVNVNVNPANTSPSAANTIVFDSTGAFATAQTITLTAPLVFDNTNTPVAIDGSSTIGLTLSGDGGAGVLVIDGNTTAFVYGLTISNGSATSGGAIDNAGTLNISDATIANSTAASGGAIDNEAGGKLVILNSTLAGNSAALGGAIYNSAATMSVPTAGVATLTDVTIADNSASLGGGGIYNAGTLTIVSSTIALNNVSTTGGGGGLDDAAGGTATLYNTIVAQNYGGSGHTINDIEGNVAAASTNNLVDDTGSAGGLVNGQGGNIIGVSADLVGGLADNGGATETIAISPLSPALNTGAASISGVVVPGKDQRGAVRNPDKLNDGATIDIGAYEISSTYEVESTADTLTSGTLRTALAWANTTPSDGLAGPNTIMFDPLMFNVNSPQTITLSATFGPLDLTNTTSGVAIVGPGAGVLTIAGDGDSSVFSIETGTTATNTLSDFTITDGSAASGGAIVNTGNLTVSGVALSGNAAVLYGGAINNDGGTLTVVDSTFTDDLATYGVGGAINNANQGTVTVINSIFTGGAAFQGGAIANTGGTLSVTDSSFTSNAGTEGGAIFNNGTATITASTIADDNTSFDGGGIANDLNGILTLVNSTIAFNNAGQTGGGINSVGKLTAINTTIAYNSVTAGGSGGGIDASSGNAVLYNTIVADNTAGTGKSATASDISGAMAAASAYNLIGTGGGGGLSNGTNGNLVGVTSPDLATSLANNGGPTETIALDFGSPAIDAGSNALAVDANGNPLHYDQREAGYPRIVDGIVDIGAFERAPATTTTLTSSLNPANFGQTVTFTANVAAAFASTNVPTGTVTFLSGTNVLGTVALVNGTATFATHLLALGTDIITAVYSGDSNFADSTSTPLSQTVSLSTIGTPVVAAATTTPNVTSAIGSTAFTTVTHKAHGKAAKKVVTSKKALPHGGSSTKFHQTKQTADLQRSVAMISKHVKVKAKKS